MSTTAKSQATKTSHAAKVAKIKAIADKLTAEILANNSATGNYEIKEVELKILESEIEPIVIGGKVIAKGSRRFFGSFSIRAGMVDDEGTLAQAFCRDYRHIMIGERGGLELMNAKKKSESRGRFYAVHAATL